MDSRRFLAGMLGMVVAMAAPGSLAAQDPQQEVRSESLEVRIARLEQQLATVLENQNALARQLGLRGVDRRDAQGRVVPIVYQDSTGPSLLDRLDAIEKSVTSPPRAPVPAVPAQGRLVVFNTTGAAQVLTVNGAPYSVNPGRADIWVPLGDVEVFLTYTEPRKIMDRSNWRWNGRDYEMTVTVRP